LPKETRRILFGLLLKIRPAKNRIGKILHRNRHQAGTEAPLPDGKYQVAKTSVAGTIPEAGDRFLAIQPLFRTGRSALGIHYDPSFEKNNGEDGTSGCIGLTNRGDLDFVLNYVRTYRPQYLEVKIQ
jgi:hypothetical protein